MTEILTESFCERCGTRYTFESAAPRRSRVGKVRTLGKGMKNFVLSDDSSFSEAMAEARSEQELAAVAHQLDAFHQTFNFCLTCRQYTCGECWNEAEGRCLTCSPIPGMEEPELTAAAIAEIPVLEPEREPLAVDAADEAWPDADLSAGRLSRALGLDEAEAEASLEAGGADDLVEHPGIAAAAVVAAADAPEPDVAELEAAEPAHVEGLAPGQSLEDAVAAYEAQLDADVAEPVAAVAAEPVIEPDAPPAAEAVVAAAAIADEAPVEEDHDALRAAMAAAALVSSVDGEDREAAAAVHAEPEPVAEPVVAAAAAPEPEPEPEPAPAPVAAAPEPEPEPVAAEPEPEPVAAEPERVDVVPQPVWPQPAPPADAPAAPTPEAPVTPANPWLTVAPEDGESPQWPAAPAWPSAPTSREMPATLAGRPLLPLGDAAGVWAASAREVLTGAATAPAQQAAVPAPTAQPCVSCGLSLSANARFCRRCGTRQA